MGYMILHPFRHAPLQKTILVRSSLLQLQMALISSTQRRTKSIKDGRKENLEGHAQALPVERKGRRLLKIQTRHKQLLPKFQISYIPHKVSQQMHQTRTFSKRRICLLNRNVPSLHKKPNYRLVDILSPIYPSRPLASYTRRTRILALSLYLQTIP